LRCAQRRREGGAIVFGETRRVRRTARMATRRVVVSDSIVLLLRNVLQMWVGVILRKVGGVPILVVFYAV